MLSYLPGIDLNFKIVDFKVGYKGGGSFEYVMRYENLKIDQVESWDLFYDAYIQDQSNLQLLSCVKENFKHSPAIDLSRIDEDKPDGVLRVKVDVDSALHCGSKVNCACKDWSRAIYFETKILFKDGEIYKKDSIGEDHDYRRFCLYSNLEHKYKEDLFLLQTADNNIDEVYGRTKYCND